MDKASIIDTLLAPTRAKGVASGALSVGFASAHSQVAPSSAATEQVQQLVETMLFLTPAEWTMIAAILTSVWTILCIARSFGLGVKSLQFLAFLGRILQNMGKPTPEIIVPPEATTPTVAKEKEDGRAQE